MNLRNSNGLAIVELTVSKEYFLLYPPIGEIVVVTLTNTSPDIRFQMGFVLFPICQNWFKLES